MGSSKSRAEARKWRRAAEKELTQELKINAEAPDLFQIREMEDSESQTKFSATSAFSVWLRFCHAQYFAVHESKIGGEKPCEGPAPNLTICSVAAEANDDFLKSLGKRIRGLRKDSKLTQEQLSGKADLHRTFIADVERGKRNLSARNLNKIAIALAVPLASLFEGLDARSEHILIADDCDDDVLLLKAAFRKAGLSHRLTHVHDGEQTITYLKGAAPFEDRKTFPFPDLLMLDIKMPNLNGFDVLDALRNLPDLRVPVVIFSASGAHEDMETALGLGAAEYFVKPVSLSAMAELVRALDERWFKSGRVQELRESRPPGSPLPIN
jgi:CheY-like chemotaxis protein